MRLLIPLLLMLCLRPGYSQAESAFDSLLQTLDNNLSDRERVDALVSLVDA